MTNIKEKMLHLKTIPKLLMAYVSTGFIYACIYYSIKGDNNFKGLNKNSTFIDCLYFSFTTTSTVGYGDISPKSQLARSIVITHHLIILSEVIYIFK
jgi:hypothetical protein